MIHTRNSQTDKVLSALEELQLSDNENQIAQEYLDGEAGDEILKGLTPRNMTSCFAVRYRLFQELFTSCLSNKKYEEASRLLRLLYAIGAYSCCDCFENADTFMDAVEKGYLDIDRAKAVAVSAQHIFMQIYRLSSNYRSRLLTTRQLERLVMFADRNPEIVLRAWKEFDDQQFSGRLLLIALYFFLRYDREGRSVGELPQGPDQALLKEYEEALTDLLGRILKAAAAGKKELQDIQEGIRRGQFQDSLLSGCGTGLWIRRYSRW